VRVASGPDPPGSSRCVFERRRTSVSRVCLSVTLAGPAPSGSAGTSRLCQGRLPPGSCSSRTRLPSTSQSRCDRTTVQVSHLHSINKRLTAHRRNDARLSPRESRPIRPRLATDCYSAVARFRSPRTNVSLRPTGQGDVHPGMTSLAASAHWSTMCGACALPRHPEIADVVTGPAIGRAGRTLDPDRVWEAPGGVIVDLDRIGDRS
jgi:hypothetical protein